MNLWTLKRNDAYDDFLWGMGSGGYNPKNRRPKGYKTTRRNKRKAQKSARKKQRK